jgi:hypothetical protein
VNARDPWPDAGPHTMTGYPDPDTRRKLDRKTHSSLSLVPSSRKQAPSRPYKALTSNYLCKTCAILKPENLHIADFVATDGTAEGPCAHVQNVQVRSTQPTYGTLITACAGFASRGVMHGDAAAGWVLECPVRAVCNVPAWCCSTVILLIPRF